MDKKYTVIESNDSHIDRSDETTYYILDDPGDLKE